MNKKISIIIPNYNGEKLLKNNLDAVITASKNYEIIVTDDHSTDNSVEFLLNNYKQIRVVENTGKKGFAGNVNNGVLASSGEIIVLLNTDVVPHSDFLMHLLPHFDDLNVFAVGCLEKSFENELIVDRGRGLAHWEKGFYVHSRGQTNSSSTAWVSGGSSAFRKSIWEKIGGMNELYNPFYWEDLDISYRARKAGYKVVFEPKSIVSHFHQKGVIKSNYTDATIQKFAYRNQFIFHWLNISDRNIIIAHIFWTPIKIIQQLISNDVQMFFGFLLALTTLKQIIKFRSSMKHSWKLKDSEIVTY